MCVGVHLGAGLDNSNFWGFWVKMKDFWMILSVFCFHRRWSRRSVKASNVLGQVAYLGCLGGAESLCHRLGVLFLPRWGGGLQGRFSLDFEERCWGGGMWSRFRGC